jgi:hypothetical protein
MKTIVIAFVMSLALLSCRQNGHGKDEQPYGASETGTGEEPEGVVSGGPNAGPETEPAVTDTTKEDSVNDATRKLPPPSERKEVTPPDISKPR